MAKIVRRPSAGAFSCCLEPVASCIADRLLVLVVGRQEHALCRQQHDDGEGKEDPAWQESDNGDRWQWGIEEVSSWLFTLVRHKTCPGEWGMHTIVRVGDEICMKCTCRMIHIYARRLEKGRASTRWDVSNTHDTKQ